LKYSGNPSNIYALTILSAELCSIASTEQVALGRIFHSHADLGVSTGILCCGKRFF